MVDLIISKKKVDFFFTPLKKIDGGVEYDRFRDFVEKNQFFFVWREDTDWGRTILANREKHKNSTLRLLEKRVACFERDIKMNDFKFKATYPENVRYISITNINPAKMTLDILEKLLEMAESCEAELWGDGKKPITRAFIEKERVTIATLIKKKGKSF
jgi:hypothetical protein